jgi:phage terminase large subunit
MGSGERKAALTKLSFPAKTAFLFEPHRYKCLYGGRGSGKSWAFARALLVLGRRRKLFIVCAREFQSSIKESVHKLVANQVNQLEWDDFYTVKESEIVGANGSKFAFVGVRNNVQSIKSMEAVDIFAVFEANLVSKNSWEVTLPTIRRDAPFGPFDQGSEIWVEWNPELDTDETYIRFALNPPPDCVSVEMNWNDNPFFPEILKEQKDEAYKRDADDARTIWGGKTRKTLKGAIFAKELELAISEGRISSNYKVDRSKPVTFSFDLGDSDMCAWFAWQQMGMEHNCIDYYGNTGHGIDHFLDEIRKRDYKVKHILLPHDAAQAHQSARGNKSGNTIEKQVRAVYQDAVRLVPRVSIVNRINAARQLFPRINFAEQPTSAGIQGLTRYQYKIDERGQRSREPLHNWASNPADAFTYYAVWLREGSVDKPKTAQSGERTLTVGQVGTSWMG